MRFSCNKVYGNQDIKYHLVDFGKALSFNQTTARGNCHCHTKPGLLSELCQSGEAIAICWGSQNNVEREATSSMGSGDTSDLAAEHNVIAIQHYFDCPLYIIASPDFDIAIKPEVGRATMTPISCAVFEGLIPAIAQCFTWIVMEDFGNSLFHKTDADSSDLVFQFLRAHIPIQADLNWLVAQIVVAEFLELT